MKTEREELKEQIETIHRRQPNIRKRRYSKVLKKQVVEFVAKCDEAGLLTHPKIAKSIGLSHSTLNEWLRSSSKKRNSLEKVAQKYNKRKSFMLKMDEVTITSTSKKAIMNHVSNMVMANIEEV